MDLETFRSQISRQIEMLREYSANFRTAERYGLVEITEKPIIFWFEKWLDAEPFVGRDPVESQPEPLLHSEKGGTESGEVLNLEP